MYAGWTSDLTASLLVMGGFIITELLLGVLSLRSK
jgi:hypothetical protein